MSTSANPSEPSSSRRGKKRKSEGSAAEPPAKRTKSAWSNLRAHFPALESYIQIIERHDLPYATGLRVCIAGLNSQYNESLLAPLLGVLEKPITMTDDPISTTVFNAVRGNAYKALLQVIREAEAIPTPSAYARTVVWGPWQQKDTAILCLRPPEKRSLPLCVLADVFRRFRNETINRSMPLDITVQDVASRLCLVMARWFENEDRRMEAFHDCVDTYLGNFGRKTFLPSSDGHNAEPGGVVLAKGIVCLIFEMKNEPGSSGDPYMQLARDYQAYISELLEKKRRSAWIARGVPVILLAIAGPVLYALGGFYDGKSTVVEPLAQPLFMLPDHTGLREREMARFLIILRNALTTLQQDAALDNIERITHQPSTPRIYASFTTTSGSQEALTFHSQLVSHHPKAMMFLATTPSSDRPVMVKLVNGSYGTFVHQVLSKNGLAPIYYGSCGLEGAPTAHIMEYLVPPSGEAHGWINFHKFRRSGLKTSSSAIKVMLDQALQVMHNAGFVHGDFRPPNIMIKVDGECRPVVAPDGSHYIKIVDFDWSGEAGKVSYPIERNDSIWWPSSCGGLIHAEHDIAMIEHWWNETPTSDS